MAYQRITRNDEKQTRNGLQHLYPRFKSGWHLLKSPGNQGFLGFFFFQNPIILSKKRVCVILMPRRPKKGTIED